MEKNEKQTIGKYYLTAFANGIKRFTQSKWMVAIVNGFIAVMPIIITASIFTLLSALPEMVMSVMWGDGWKSHINADSFGQYQTWASAISNWSMGIIGMFATAAIARNLAVELNNKLPFERRMNETMVFFAAISVYLMLSVMEFTVPDYASHPGFLPDWIPRTSGGRAIFVDGLAAQGILPGIIIGLTLPYIFYVAYKRNWTIRLPKQVPQTISQAFLAIIPLFLVFAVYGSIGFGFNKWLNQPILFWLFSQIQSGLQNNPNLNDRAGLFAIYTLMEGGFWFLGVHPEPVHAIMRATFWFSNIDANAVGAHHIFIEPIAYGYGAMGGSGCTLMLPLLCLICCRSTQMKVTGKTAVLPIFFQVNEPALFGVPTILNPVFALPMIFTGMIIDLLFIPFHLLSSAYVVGSLYLPWSTPYFLQTALPDPTSWIPWVYNLIALAICTLTYLPAVLIQDKIYLKEESRKLGMNSINFKPINGLDLIKNKLFTTDAVSRRSLKVFKKKQKLDIAKLLANAKSEQERAEILINAKVELFNQSNKALYLELQNLIKFADNLSADKLAALNRKKQAGTDKVDDLIQAKVDKLSKKQAKFKAKITKQEEKIKSFNNIIDTTKDKIALKQKIWKDTHPDQELPVKDKEALSIRFAKKQINKAYDRIKFLESTAQRTKDALNKKIEEKTAALNVVKQAIVELQKTDPENQHSFSLKLLNCKSKRIQKQIDKAISKRDADPTKISIKSKVADLDIEFQKANLELERKHTLACIKAVKKYDKRSNRLIARAKRNEIELSKIAVPAEYSKFVDSAKLIDEINANEIAVKSKWDELKTNNRNKLLNGVNPWAPVEQPVEVVEAKEKAPAEKANAPKGLDPNKKYQVLVLCLGAGSSAVLANAINAGLKQAKITNIKAAALAWGSHESALGSADLVILSPQLGSHANNLSKQAAVKGYKLIACRGRDYIELSKNPKSAVETVVNELTKE